MQPNSMSAVLRKRTRSRRPEVAGVSQRHTSQTCPVPGSTGVLTCATGISAAAAGESAAPLKVATPSTSPHRAAWYSASET